MYYQVHLNIHGVDGRTLPSVWDIIKKKKKKSGSTSTLSSIIVACIVSKQFLLSLSLFDEPEMATVHPPSSHRRRGVTTFFSERQGVAQFGGADDMSSPPKTDILEKTKTDLI